MSEIRSFETTLLEGSLGELKIKQYLESIGFLVSDKSDDLSYQARDIDFMCYIDGFYPFSLEIKSDNRMFETGNIAIEISMRRQSGVKKGWFHYCDADILCFLDAVQNIAYFIDWHKLKCKIQEYTWTFCVFDNKIDNCKGTLCLVPITDLLKYDLLVNQVSLNSN